MEDSNRRGWLVVGSLAAVLCIVQGPAGSTIGVFLPAIIRQFGATHAQAARIATASILATGIVSPAVGWLLDRVQARWVMACGIALTAAGYLLGSRANSLTLLIVAYALLGVGVAAGTFLPATLVAVGWFKERRGLAIGLALVGFSVGMTIWPMVVGQQLVHHPWRQAMVWLAVPMLLVALPLVLLAVRQRAAGGNDPKAQRAALAGLDSSQLVRARAFWLLLAVQCLYALAVGSIYIFIVSYLIWVGFSPPMAATIFGIQALGAGVGFLVMGWLADRLGARPTMLLTIAGSVFSILCLSHAGPSAMGWLFVVVFCIFWSTTAGAPHAIIPLLAAEALGMRRFGAVIGVLQFLSNVCLGSAPLVSGRIFDVTGGYGYVLMLAIALHAGGALCSALIYPAPGHDAVPEALQVAAG